MKLGGGSAGDVERWETLGEQKNDNLKVDGVNAV